MKSSLWFFDHNIRIFPIKYKDKEPACKSWDDYSCTREYASTFSNYGVALGLLGVADSDMPEAESWNALHLIDTPFKVTTGRGRHRYYRLVHDVPHFIHRDGHTIEFRHKGQYVVGPGSTHSSGAIYTADNWSWDISDIPFFPTDFLWDDRAPELRGSADGNPLVLPPSIYAGERHDLMFKLMRSLQARGVVDLAVLLKVLHAENKIKCHPPISEDELTRYITRVSAYHDVQGFVRHEQDDITIAGGMLDVGLSVETATLLADSETPDVYFDVTIDKDLLEFGSEDPAVSQPSQPFLETENVTPNDSQNERPERRESDIDTRSTRPDIDSIDIAVSSPSLKSSLLCLKCGHDWIQKRKAPPKKCPRCHSILWNKELLLPIYSFGEPDDPSLMESNSSEGFIDLAKEHENDEVFELETEDGDIHDEETLEVVGHIKDGVITWYDK